MTELERAKVALFSIPADLPREDWVRAGMAYKAANGNFDTFDDWSQQGATYNAKDARDTWKSFKADGAIGVGTLFHMAQKHGAGRRSSASSPPLQPSKPSTSSPPSQSAAEVWARCEVATNAHPYVKSKCAEDLPMDELRVLSPNDTLTILGEPMAGALVVPVMHPSGNLSSLQFITLPEITARLDLKGKKGKLNLPGHTVDGWFTVGNPANGGDIYLVEGIGQAWACFKATGSQAVVCFGAGNIEKVAMALRQKDPQARLIVVPDVGKEGEAQKIAEKVDGYVASLPEGWDRNSDVNDLMQRDGIEALRSVLIAASEPVKTPHPLAKFVEFSETTKAPRWVIPGFIGHGVTLISGAHGAGKTTALLPLAMTAAGLHGDELIPCEWRHVVYVTEDIEQAQRILSGIVRFSNLGLNWQSVQERLHFVEAVRLDPAFVATVGTTYRKKFTRLVKDVEIRPLVVLDTRSAVLALESENDNSEASAMMAALKQGFEGLPVWLVGHVAKTSLSRSDVAALTSRGASAVEGDANQTMFLVREGDKRYLLQGKTRFEPKWRELEIVSHSAQVNAPDEFGNQETVTLRWGIASPSDTTRKEALQLAQEQAKKDDAATLRQDIRDAVEVAWVTGNPLNREGAKAKIQRNKAVVGRTLENLISERWLYEVPVPTKERRHPKQSTFLVNFTTEEHEAFVRDGILPEKKLVIPQTWKKPVSPSIPAPEGESSGLEGQE